MAADENPEEYKEPANLRLLRRLVTVLMVVMILGVVSIVALVVIRFSDSPAPILPDTLSLPAGSTADAVTVGNGWVAVVTTDAKKKQHVLIYDATTGSLQQKIDMSQ